MDVLISVENFEDGETAREINSPRSLESCLRSGLDPSELFPKAYERFASKKLTKVMIEIKHENYEKKRQEKVAIVKVERNSIIQYAERHNQMMNLSSPPQTPNNNIVNIREGTQKESTLLDMEERRIEALKRRQEKELSKIVEREQIMATLQMKIKRVEDEDVLKRKAHEKKVADQKALATRKNILRMQELDRLDKEETMKKKDLARKDQDFDQKMKNTAIEAEKKSIREIRQRDEERNSKIEESRRKTDILIQGQIEQAAINRLKLLERESRVQNQLQEKRETKREEVRNEKEKATKRIGEALERHHILHEDRKIKFFERQKEAGMRAGEVMSGEKLKQKKLGDDRDRKNKQRLSRLLDAYKTRSGHRQDIVDRRLEKDKTYERVQSERDAHQAMLKFASDMRIHDKIENVERVARMNEFHRLQTLKRIEDAENRYDNIQRQRHEILCKHKDEVKMTLTRKHEISHAMDQMKISNDFSLLDKLFISKKNKGSTVGNTTRDNVEGEDERLTQTA